MRITTFIGGGVALATALGAATAARAEDGGAMRLALVDLPGRSSAGALDVRTELASAGGELAACSDLGLGLGAGFTLQAAGSVREAQVRGQMQHRGALEGGLGFDWGGARRRAQVGLGYQRRMGEELSNRVLGRVGVRSTGATWVAAALELGLRDELDGTLAAAVGGGGGPVTPALEIKAGRCDERCAMGSVGVQVRLPSTFALGLALVGEALPRERVGITVSLGWTSGADDGDER